jgi:hypothetical protein
MGSQVECVLGECGGGWRSIGLEGLDFPEVGFPGSIWHVECFYKIKSRIFMETLEFRKLMSGRALAWAPCRIEVTTMKTHLQAVLKQSLRAFVLWGYGWRRRQRCDNESRRIEWQDPITGLWYREKAAFRVLKMQVLADYAPPVHGNTDSRFYF